MHEYPTYCNPSYACMGHPRRGRGTYWQGGWKAEAACTINVSAEGGIHVTKSGQRRHTQTRMSAHPSILRRCHPIFGGKAENGAPGTRPSEWSVTVGTFPTWPSRLSRLAFSPTAICLGTSLQQDQQGSNPVCLCFPSLASRPRVGSLGPCGRHGDQATQ